MAILMYIHKNRLTTPKTCICATPENGREYPASVKRAHDDLKPFFPKQQKTPILRRLSNA